jgi:hypothetical protein
MSMHDRVPGKSMWMTAGELRAIIADVPEDVPVAIRVSPNGYDAVSSRPG